MIASPDALYKLIILYMAAHTELPLGAGLIADYLVARSYTSYFRMQEALAEMTESELLSSEHVEHSTRYQITESGRDTLACFTDEISPEIRAEADAFLAERELLAVRENDLRADYKMIDEDWYEISLLAAENGVTQLALTLSVHDMALAQKICDQWKEKNADVYAAVLKLLG